MFEVIEKRDFTRLSGRDLRQCALVKYNENKYIACISSELIEDEYSGQMFDSIYDDVIRRIEKLLQRSVSSDVVIIEGARYIILGNNNYPATN